jgi:hypothetical protein
VVISEFGVLILEVIWMVYYGAQGIDIMGLKEANGRYLECCI